VSWLSLIGAMLLASFLATSHLIENRFHADEAHYAGFARLIASGPGRGLLLSHIVVDKPPLAFYVDGLSVVFIGPSELALRLPALLCSILNIALIYGLGRRLYGPPAAHVAAWAMVLSPMAVQFAITAFVDPLMNMLVLATLYLAAARRPYWSAAALGLAFATKQTALFAIPLVSLVELWRLPRPWTIEAAFRKLLAVGLPILLSLAIIVILLVAWDARRGAPISIWEQGYSDNVPGRPVALAELRPRAAAILFLLGQMSRSPLFNSIFVAGLAILLALDARWPSKTGGWDLLLTAYVVGYILLFWLVPFNLWDRYFLPLLPLMALLAGRVSILLYRSAIRAVEAGALIFARRRAGQWHRAAQILLPLVALAILIPQAVAANYDFSPIGGDHGAYDGIDDTARFIRTLPANSTLYDHWLGWELEYYLFERQLPVVWFPDMATFERNLAEAPAGRSLYLVAPWWAPADEARHAAERAGRHLTAVHESYRRDGVVSVTVYEISP
jgi:4-amino-4-deoxy-L-arabinose transferase-like glycosyltransferase